MKPGLNTAGRILAYFFEHPNATYWKASMVLGITERVIQAHVRAMVKEGHMELRHEGHRAVKTVTQPTTASLLVRVGRRSRP